jgi:hypothetical protein
MSDNDRMRTEDLRKRNRAIPPVFLAPLPTFGDAFRFERDAVWQHCLDQVALPPKWLEPGFLVKDV